MAKSRTVATQRQWELALAARWVQRGMLDRPEDFYWLRIEDAERAAAADTVPCGWLRARVARHRACCRKWAGLPAPDFWCEGQEGQTAPAAEPENGQTFRGLPVAPGVVEGEAVVLKDPSDVTSLRPGQILVVSVAGPSWTPLFALAGGLVVEIGGTLSHGAMLAREFQLPTVANVPDATHLFHSGEHIRVDGTQGLVERLSVAPEKQHERRLEDGPGPDGLHGAGRHRECAA